MFFLYKPLLFKTFKLFPAGSTYVLAVDVEVEVIVEVGYRDVGSFAFMMLPFMRAMFLIFARLSYIVGLISFLSRHVDFCSY